MAKRKDKSLPGTVRPMTPGQTRDLGSALLQALPTDFSFEEAQKLVGRKSDINKQVGSVLKSMVASPATREGKKKLIPATHPDSLLRLRDLWIECWKVVGGRDDLPDSDLVLPAYQTSFDWPVIKPRDLTAQQAYDLTDGAKLFPCWKYWDTLDVLEVKEAYLQPIAEAPVILIRSSVEADTRVSYDQAITRRLLFIGISQRILLELFGAWLNRDHTSEAQALQIPDHLDVVGWTRTSFLAPDGYVASAYWGPESGEFGVGWSDRDDARPRGGIRQAVCPDDPRQNAVGLAVGRVS